MVDTPGEIASVVGAVIAGGGLVLQLLRKGRISLFIARGDEPARGIILVLVGGERREPDSDGNIEFPGAYEGIGASIRSREDRTELYYFEIPPPSKLRVKIDLSSDGPGPDQDRRKE